MAGCCYHTRLHLCVTFTAHTLHRTHRHPFQLRGLRALHWTRLHPLNFVALVPSIGLVFTPL